jgi:hypothetical protein
MPKPPPTALRGLAAVFLCSACAFSPHRFDVSGESPYSPAIGLRYALKKNAILFQNGVNGGTAAGEPGSAGLPVESELTGKATPFQYNAGMTVLGVLPAGSVIEIEKIWREESYEGTGLMIQARVAASPDGALGGKTVDVGYLFLQEGYLGVMPPPDEDFLEEARAPSAPAPDAAPAPAPVTVPSPPSF